MMILKVVRRKVNHYLPTKQQKIRRTFHNAALIAKSCLTITLFSEKKFFPQTKINNKLLNQITLFIKTKLTFCIMMLQS